MALLALKVADPGLIYPNVCGFGTLSHAGVPDLAVGRPLVDILPLFN